MQVSGHSSRLSTHKPHNHSHKLGFPVRAHNAPADQTWWRGITRNAVGARIHPATGSALQPRIGCGKVLHCQRRLNRTCSITTCCDEATSNDLQAGSTMKYGPYDSPRSKPSIQIRKGVAPDAGLAAYIRRSADSPRHPGSNQRRHALISSVRHRNAVSRGTGRYGSRRPN